MKYDEKACAANIESRPCEQALQTLSPFEVKNKLISLAEANARRTTAIFLNAGRGNPNWITVEPRRAFLLLGEWAIEEGERVHSDPAIGICGMPEQAGAGARLRAFIEANKGKQGASLLLGALDYLVTAKGMAEDEVAEEWATAILGDTYPTPDRILRFAETLCQDYLDLELGDGAPHTATYDLFATEGGTAAMCYTFISLMANRLLRRGDKIALMTPVFTPYIEIPKLQEYSFEVVNISANALEKDGYHDWQYADEEIDKLRDPAVQLVCIVNPSNPPSYALSEHTLERIADIVRTDNPNLMIVTDDVYGSFVKGFKSLTYILPQNTLCVYSFSKYFGATGWRLAVMALAKDNVFDRLIAALPEAERRELDARYESITLDVPSLKFIDRLVADSRLVALNHTAGLSTPQQMQMALFAAFILLDKEGKYRADMQALVSDRLEALWSTTGFTLRRDPLCAAYYSEIDLMVWAKKIYSDAFADYLDKNYEPIDFVIRLANETAIVLLNGDGFDGPKWSVRVSLANLTKDSYLRIGTAIRTILADYYKRFAEGR